MQGSPLAVWKNAGETTRDLAGRKGAKGLSQAGHEEVPRGFGLGTGDHEATQLVVLGTTGGLPAELG